MVNKLKAFVKKKPDLSIWLFVFIVTSCIALLVQLLFLPVVFPSWHAFDGMLASADTATFHRKAVEIAHSIREEGWSVWELRPRGWMPVGVASAIYALTMPKPWVLIPLNAAVHATTILIVIKILLFFTSSRKISFIAAMPFAFFPSAALWYAQIHRDGYHILGVIMFLYGLIYITCSLDNTFQSKLLLVAKGFLVILGGVLLLWVVRPYHVVVLQYVFLLMLLFIAVVLLFKILQKKVNWKLALLQLAAFVVLFVLITPLTSTTGARKYQTQAVDPDTNDQDTVYSWERINWIPGRIDNYLYSMAYLRSVRFPSRYSESASSIDYDKKFHSGYDFLLYIPRALQIAFLAPFPNTWFGEGSHEATTAFRRVVIVEMMFIYLVIPFVIYALWFWRNKIELWLLYIFCIIMVLPIVYGVPNVGTIYRYRYGYLMLLVAMGVVVFIELFNKYRKRPKIENNSN